MNTFYWPRFQRILTNDLLIQGRKTLMATLALMAVGLLVYLIAVDNLPPAETPRRLYQILFLAALLGGGFIFTSLIFSDMHHPLERFHYLTLPCSNFERLLSRYLISGPLFYLYTLAAYTLFEVIARVLSLAVLGRAGQFFDPTNPLVMLSVKFFFAVHPLVFLGAIYFQDRNLAKTVLSLAAIGLAGFAVYFISVHIFYWEYFSSFFTLQADGNLDISINFRPLGNPTWWQVLIYLWVLFLSYTRLRDHEV